MATSQWLGAHVSAAGGVENAIERAVNIGANCVQIFSNSPRVWAKPPLERFNPETIAAKKKEKNVGPIITHALYLVNLASDNPELLEKSHKALVFDMNFDNRIKGDGVVVHLGSHQGKSWPVVREQVAEGIKAILEESPEDAHFLIENSAGQNGKLCSDLDEIRWLLDQVKSPKLGWCVDTCHAFAAGYSLGDTKTERLSLVDDISRLDLWETLRCVHVNDSRDPFGSGRDRHDNLGEGNIPTEDLRSFLHHPEVIKKPKILEVPGENKEGPDAENIQRLQKLVE